MQITLKTTEHIKRVLKVNVVDSPGLSQIKHMTRHRVSFIVSFASLYSEILPQTARMELVINKCSALTRNISTKMICSAC
jgi:hypothetical protein